ncbi:MAG: radical SAM protein, partial [Actinobacteria bacterium]
MEGHGRGDARRGRAARHARERNAAGRLRRRGLHAAVRAHLRERARGARPRGHRAALGAVEIAQTVRGARQAGADRAGVLEALARVPGVYVPALYAPGPDGGLAPLSAAAPERVTRRVVPDLDAEPSVACPVVPFVDVVHDRVTVEVTRGCTRGCRFCHAGMVYRPVRERTADSIVRDVMAGLRCTGYEEVSLTSLSTTDHSQLPDVLRRLARRLEGSAVAVSLPSLRADAFGVRMAQLVSRGKKPGLTLAPEAGTQRMRDVINKNVTEDDLLAA